MVNFTCWHGAGALRALLPHNRSHCGRPRPSHTHRQHLGPGSGPLCLRFRVRPSGFWVGDQFVTPPKCPPSPAVANCSTMTAARAPGHRWSPGRTKAKMNQELQSHTGVFSPFGAIAAFCVFINLPSQSI